MRCSVAPLAWPIAYRACIRDPEGNDHWMSGVYQEIVPARRIVMTFRWEDGVESPWVAWVHGRISDE